MHRVVITGLGVVSPIGHNVPAFAANLFAGQSGISTITYPKPETETKFPGAPVRDFAPEKVIDAKKLGFMDRFSQFAVVAAREAMQDAALTLPPDLALRTAVILGTGAGGQNTLEESYDRLHGSANGRVHPFTVPRLMANAAASQVSMDLGAMGPAYSIASACASATHAMGVAMQMVRAGMVEIAITGGSEACLNFGTLKGWEALRVMAPDVCRPFSRDRQGMVLGEGGAIIVLETLESAQKRGAKIYAEFAGFGQSADAKDITTPDVNGMARALSAALSDAGLSPADIDHINAHGTGTRANDLTETAAIHQVFGDRAKKMPVSGNKSLFGHALGAAGALEMIATVLAVHRDLAPPTAHFLGPDPECDLDIVQNEARPTPIRAALNNSFAFGGLNAVLAVRKWVNV